MPRRREVPKRDILPDPKFGSVDLSKFMNVIMESGKKAVAERIIYGALEQVEKKSGKDPLEIFIVALNNIKPMVEVKSRRVGGANYLGDAAHRAHLDRHLIVRAADAARLDLDHRLDVVQGDDEDLERVLAGFLLDLLERTVDDAFGNGLLARLHDHVHELGEIDRAELRIGEDVPLGDFATTRHGTSFGFSWSTRRADLEGLKSPPLTRTTAF